MSNRAERSELSFNRLTGREIQTFNTLNNKTIVSIRYSSQKRPVSVVEPNQSPVHWVLSVLSSMPECVADRPPWSSADIKKNHVQYLCSVICIHGMHVTTFPYFTKALPSSGSLSIKLIQFSIFSRSSNPFRCPQNFPYEMLCQLFFNTASPAPHLKTFQVFLIYWWFVQ